MKYKEYDEIILDITKNASETEKKKISEEDELFRIRGWEKYILALVNFLMMFLTSTLKPIFLLVDLQQILVLFRKQQAIIQK